MTHDTVTNFAASLVEMAKAHERVPELERECAGLKAQHIDDGERIARLEMKLMDRAEELSTLTAKLRSVEAERDEVGFRHLESEDKISALMASLRTVFSSVGETLKAAQPEAEPVKVEHVVSVPEAVPESNASHDVPLIESGHGEYFNVRYYDWPKYVNLHDWLAGGGTEADYTWRPGADHPMDPTPVPPTTTGTGMEHEANATETYDNRWWEKKTASPF